MSDNNTAIWDQLKRVPPEHLKGFTRAGGFKGTAIKPMWTIHTMTKLFGPCGQGWGINEPSFTTVPAGDEILVFCTVSIWHGNREQVVYGVGGDKVRVVQSSGPKNDDEAFKKCFTDAVTNACKSIGAGADVHMGLWDGNKYITAADDDAPAPVMGIATGTPGASKAPARPAYDRLVNGIRQAPTLKALTKWSASNMTAVDELPPDFVEELRVEYMDRKAELTRDLAA